MLKGKILKIASRDEDSRIAWISSELRKLPRGLRILDAGAGECPFKKECSHLVYVSQDFARYDGKGNGVGLQTGAWDQTKIDIISDITAIPVPDASFDAVLCTEVLEHVPDPVKALEEFARVLKKKGVLILSAPFVSMTHFSPFHFCTGFNKYFYETHLGRLGFTITQIIPSGDYFDSISQALITLPTIAEQYSGSALAKALWMFVLPALFLLRVMRTHDKKSSELLCFEYFVRAVKQ